MGRRFRSPSRCFSSVGSGVDSGADSENSDLLITGLNGIQDISVKVTRSFTYCITFLFTRR